MTYSNILMTCLLQEYLNLKEGDIVEHQGNGETRLCYKVSDTRYYITRIDHSLQKKFVFLGMEEVPDVFMGNNTEYEAKDRAYKTRASKWLLIDENKIVYKCWSNKFRVDTILKLFKKLT